MDKLAHASQKVGLASAMAVVLMVLILIVTGIQKWVEWYFLGTSGCDAQIEIKRRKKRVEAERAAKEMSSGKGAV